MDGETNQPVCILKKGNTNQDNESNTEQNVVETEQEDSEVETTNYDFEIQNIVCDRELSNATMLIYNSGNVDFNNENATINFLNTNSDSEYSDFMIIKNVNLVRSQTKLFHSPETLYFLPGFNQSFRITINNVTREVKCPLSKPSETTDSDNETYKPNFVTKNLNSNPFDLYAYDTKTFDFTVTPGAARSSTTIDIKVDEVINPGTIYVTLYPTFVSYSKEIENPGTISIDTTWIEEGLNSIKLKSLDNGEFTISKVDMEVYGVSDSSINTYVLPKNDVSINLYLRKSYVNRGETIDALIPLKNNLPGKLHELRFKLIYSSDLIVSNDGMLNQPIFGAENFMLFGFKVTPKDSARIGDYSLRAELCYVYGTLVENNITIRKDNIIGRENVVNDRSPISVSLSYDSGEPVIDIEKTGSGKVEGFRVNAILIKQGNSMFFEEDESGVLQIPHVSDSYDSVSTFKEIELENNKARVKIPVKYNHSLLNVDETQTHTFRVSTDYRYCVNTNPVTLEVE